MENPVLLTQTVKKGGCAAKLPAGELRAVLEAVKPRMSPEVVTGFESMDDAALWDLGNGQLLIQTLDFFTPIVDDPFDFGAIAATNALSDVYAMGGEPKTAMSILAFPTAVLDRPVLLKLMQGAIQKIEESGASLVGGHSIDDETLKLGFSVSGFVPKEKAWRNTGAKVGDALILTKPIGTGTIASALKIREAQADWVADAIRSMTTLNRVNDLIPGAPVHAATDITGFGLAIHAFHIARGSSLSIRLDMSQVPVLPGAKECIEKKVLNRAHKTNAEYILPQLGNIGAISETQKWLLMDPQTSGGLLLSVPEKEAKSIVSSLRPRFPHAVIVGSVDARAVSPLVLTA